MIGSASAGRLAVASSPKLAWLRIRSGDASSATRLTPVTSPSSAVTRSARLWSARFRAIVSVSGPVTVQAGPLGAAAEAKVEPKANVYHAATHRLPARADHRDHSMGDERPTFGRADDQRERARPDRLLVKGHRRLNKPGHAE